MGADVSYEGPGEPALSTEVVRTWADRMLRAMGIEDAELSVLLCDDARIQELNRDYRQLDRPTDVLAFSLLEGEGVGAPGLLVLGDVVIALPTAERQAREAGRDLRSEAKMLLAHGLLHLLGFDHAEPDEERRMRARTDLLVSACETEPPAHVDNL